MPGFDWQFAVVTLFALGAAGVVVRRLLPARKVKARGADAPPTPPSVACSHCATGEVAMKSAARATPRTETVPVVPIQDLRASAHQRRS
jgi:hypothetical protein